MFALLVSENFLDWRTVEISRTEMRVRPSNTESDCRTVADSGSTCFESRLKCCAVFLSPSKQMPWWYHDRSSHIPSCSSFTVILQCLHSTLCNLSSWYSDVKEPNGRLVTYLSIEATFVSDILRGRSVDLCVTFQHCCLPSAILKYRHSSLQEQYRR